MAAAGSDVGTGSTITYNSSFLTALTNISWSGIAREAIESSHMGTTGGKTFIPADLYDPGELQIEGQFEATSNIATPIVGASETITITFPGADTWVASGFMTAFEVTDPLDDMMTYSATLKLSGGINVTDTS